MEALATRRKWFFALIDYFAPVSDVRAGVDHAGSDAAEGYFPV